MNNIYVAVIVAVVLIMAVMLFIAAQNQPKPDIIIKQLDIEKATDKTESKPPEPEDAADNPYRKLRKQNHDTPIVQKQTSQLKAMSAGTTPEPIKDLLTKPLADDPMFGMYDINTQAIQSKKFSMEEGTEKKQSADADVI